jgi:ribosomal protein S18 acetylase RimI-like enzyme
VLELWAAGRSAVATTRDDEEVIERLLGADPEAVLVAEHEGTVIGALIAGWDGWRGNMYRLAVAPEHRRRGIASRLVSAGERRLRGSGARRVTALIGSEDRIAQSLWRAVGYERDPGVARFVRNL